MIYKITMYFENGEIAMDDWEGFCENEDEEIDAIDNQFRYGNYSCDCNRQIFIDRMNGAELDLGEYRCGDTLKISELRIATPGGRIVSIKNI